MLNFKKISFFNKLRRNKRGDEGGSIIGIPMGEAIGIFAAVFVIVIITVLILKMLGFFGQEKAAAIENLRELTTKIQDMLDNQNSPVFEKDIPYYKPGGYLLMAFDTDYKPFNANKRENIERPEDHCYYQACICLFTNINAEEVIVCKPFVEKINFITYGNMNDYWKTRVPKDDEGYIELFTVKKAIFKLYIEKAVTDKGTTVFIDELSDEEVKKRKEQLKKD